MDQKRPGFGSFLKCVVRKVILSIDPHFIVVVHYYSFVCYRNLSFVRTVEWENVRVFSLNAKTVLELQFDRSSNIWCVKNILFTMCTAECTFRLAILLLKDRTLDYFVHTFGTTRSLLLSALGTALTDMISPVYTFLVLNFCTQGFLWGVLLCLKIGSWKEMNRVIFLWMLLFFCPSFLV